MLGYFFEISDIRDLVHNFVEEEKNLFDRIVTKFLKVSEKRRLQDTQSYTYYTNIIHWLLLFLFITGTEISVCYISKKKSNKKQADTNVEDLEEN